MGTPSQKTYKRSWRNLLLDRGYQLRFTLFMVVLSAALMGLLGYWVMRVADGATQVALNEVDGQPCPEVPVAASAGAQDVPPGDEAPGAEPADEGAAGGDEAGDEPTGDEAGADEATGDEAAADELDLDDPEAAAQLAEAAAGEGEEAVDDETDVPDTGEAGAAAEDGAEGDRPRSRPVVTIDDSELVLPPPQASGPSPEEIAQATKEREVCLSQQASLKSEILARKTLITRILIAVGVLMIIGLAIYGIKMTHKVAGPLYKITLYMAKLKDGKYDTVYNLRKGDQLVEFYEHFKAAHAGLRNLQEEDLERLRAIVKEADSAGLADKSPELKAAIEELRTLVEEKEKSLG